MCVCVCVFLFVLEAERVCGRERKTHIKTENSSCYFLGVAVICSSGSGYVTYYLKLLKILCIMLIVRSLFFDPGLI